MGSHKSFANGTLDVSVTKKFGQRVQKKIVSQESPVNKRSSPRLREIPDSKRPYYGPTRKRHSFSTQLHENNAVADNRASQRKPKYSPISCLPNLSQSEIKTTSCLATKINSLGHEKDVGDGESNTPISGLPTPSKRELETYHSAAPSPATEGVASYVVHTRNDKARVKKTLRIYNKYYLHFFQEQNACESNGKQLAKHLDLKKDGVRSIKRPDMKAISKMLGAVCLPLNGDIKRQPLNR